MRRATPESDPTLQTLRPLARIQRASEEDTPQHTSEPTAGELLGRMKADGLITERRDGSYHLRSYGRDALLALSAIHLQSGGKR